MEIWNNFHQNDTNIVYFQPNTNNRKQLRANGRKRFPFLQGWGTNLKNFQHNQIGSRRVRIISLNKCPLSNPLIEHNFNWFWMFFQFLGQFGGSGLSNNKWENSNIYLLLVYFFVPILDLFYDCSNCPLLFFRGTRYFQYLQNNFFPGKNPPNGTQPGSLLEIFPILGIYPYFFHIPFISFQKNPVGHNGNNQEIFGFHLFFISSCQFLNYFDNQLSYFIFEGYQTSSLSLE